MPKPLQSDCERYCADFPCNRTYCHRKKGFTGKGDITMLDEKTVRQTEYWLRKMLYNEPRETIENGRQFKRPRMI